MACGFPNKAYRPIVAEANPTLDARDAIRVQARDAGFDTVGFAAPELGARAQQGLTSFLDKGWHGDMSWYAAKADRRGDPRVLWSDVRSVVVLGMNYGPDSSPMEILNRRDRGAISVYAQGRDYHDVVKKRLKRVARWMHGALDCEVKVFVDTAPVAEKPLAQRGGLGWQGKHTNLVSRSHGSWLFLGEIYTTLNLAPDAAESDHCGGCRRCLDICPTNAFPTPYTLDARRCISYLTIEHKGHIPVEFRQAMGNRIYGCDDCLAVCPWNKFAQTAAVSALQAREHLRAPALAELAALDDAAFRLFFSGSPVKRTGRDRFVRNVLIAIGNSEDAVLAVSAEKLLRDESPLVRAMAVWASGRLLNAVAFESLRAAYLSGECDADVRREWLALST
jgi:epoxyqueuosine reductase